jgi:GT2 family glycosyltransferase
MVVQMATLSVVVPATDRPATLGNCRAAIEAADDRPDDVIVVDGPRALSASAARNAGARRATGDIVVFVDADVVVHRDAFTAIRRAFAQHPEAAAVFGSYDDRPTAPGVVSAFRNLLHHHVHHAGDRSAETFWTGLGAIRRDTFLAVGGFDDERYPHPSIEDIELGHRIRASGEAIVLDPTIQGTHLKRWTLRSMLWTDFARRGVPWVALQLRTGRLSRTLNCGWRHRLSAVACLAAIVVAVAGAPLLAAGFAGALVALNHQFYFLLGRRLGPLGALAGMGLHAAHHLVALAAVPAGLAVALGERLTSRREARPTPAAAAPDTP